VLLDLGNQPVAERYGSSQVYPLVLLECRDCTLVQLSWIVPQAELFPADHPYTTGKTGALRAHFAELTRDLERDLDTGDLVVDIGANDGTLLSSYGDKPRRVAVEPTGQAAKCRQAGYRTWQAFFTSDVARDILHVSGPAKVITATNVLAHVPDPHDFCEGVRTLLADDGVFVTENHDVGAILDGLQIDTVYHEHLRYYSAATLSRLLAMHDLIVTSVQPVPQHGGSFQARAVRRRNELAFRAADALYALSGLMRRVTNEGFTVYGIGATTRATPLIHAAGLKKMITMVCEVTGSEKIGLTIPGTQIPIVDEKALYDDQPRYALLLSWHLAADLIPKIRAHGYQGRFIIPLPAPEVVSG
jgi:hypothetical protein